MRFVHHAIRVENVCCIQEKLRANISSKSNIAYLSLCFLLYLFNSYFQICEMDTWGLSFDLEVRQGSESLLAG